MLVAAALAVTVGPRLAGSVEPTTSLTDGLADLARPTGPEPAPATADADGPTTDPVAPPGDEPADSREAGPDADGAAAPDTSSTAPPRPGAGIADRRDPITAEDVPAVAAGTFSVAAAARPVGAEGQDGEEAAEPEDAVAGELTYSVEVEDGLPFPGAATAATVDRVLGDARGWESYAGQPLRRTVDDPDFRVLLASPGTTDLLCAPLATNGEVSCRNGDLVVLNALRWAVGVPDYDGRLRQYRTYLVNHEVGHRLGYEHVECPGPGAPAPVMQQQTYGLDGCRRNAWPG